MSPRPQGPTPAEREEMARLLPFPAERDLPGGRHRLLKDRLMREVRRNADADPAASPARRRRLPFAAIPLAAGALAAVLALALAAGGLRDRQPSASGSDAAGGSDGASAAALLDRIATVAASRPEREIRDDQYICITSTVAYAAMSESDLRLDKPHRRQVWLSVDGSGSGLLRENGEEIELESTETPAPGLDAGVDPGPSLNSPTYRYLETLPTDPDVLLKKIYEETEGAGPGPHEEAFVTIGELLREQLVPPEVSAALYRAAAMIPGVTVVDDAVDAAGRHGVAVARTHDGERVEWIFDRQTLEYRGERGVMVRDTTWAEAGQVTATTAVLSRAVTDEPGQTPGRG